MFSLFHVCVPFAIVVQSTIFNKVLFMVYRWMLTITAIITLFLLSMYKLNQYFITIVDSYPVIKNIILWMDTILFYILEWFKKIAFSMKNGFKKSISYIFFE